METKSTLISDDTTEKQVFSYLRNLAEQIPEVHKITLFGSRARRDHGPRSDFDIAVLAPTMSDSQWSKLVDTITNHIPTLCGVDIVRIDSTISESLSSAIARDGVGVYEKQNLPS